MAVSAYAFAQLAPGPAAGHRPEDVLSAAWAQAEEVRRRAYEEGFEAGRLEGRAEFAAQAAPALDALAAGAAEFGAARTAAVSTLERQAAELALLVAEHVIGGAVAVEPERIVEVCRGALRRLAERQQVVAVVNPEDLEVLSAQAEALRSQLGGIEHFEVQADRRVGRGGCLVRTVEAEIDATIRTQLQQARTIVAEALTAGLSEPLTADLSEPLIAGASEPLTAGASEPDGVTDVIAA